MTWGGLKPGIYHVFVRDCQRDGVGRRHRGRRRRTARAHRRRRRHEAARDRCGVLGHEWAALMFRHIALIVALTAVALAAGVAMVPGEREQWTMLVRDGRNQEAITALETRYSAGKREVDAVLHLYKLYMAFAEIDQATRIMRDFVTDRPDDPAAVAMLAKHYGDIQNKARRDRARSNGCSSLRPRCRSRATLLAHYRLEGAFDREQSLLRTLLANQMITANDAERLGLHAGRARRPLRRPRRAHPFRRDRQPGTHHRTARPVRHARANRRQDDCARARRRHGSGIGASPAFIGSPGRKSRRFGSSA